MQVVKNDTKKKMHGRLNIDKLNMKRDETKFNRGCGYKSSGIDSHVVTVRKLSNTGKRYRRSLRICIIN